MKIGYYIDHATISAGGVFTYSIAILKQLINLPELEKLIVFTSREVSEKLNGFGNKDKLEPGLRSFVSLLDKAAQKGIIRRRTASRKIARMSKKISRILKKS